MATDNAAQVFDLRFEHFDANKDGRIDRSDFEQEANSLIRAFGADQDSPRALALKNSYLAVYEYIVRKADATSGVLRREEFVAASKAAITDRGGAGFGEVLAPYAHACANLCDADGDGEISQDEYSKWLTVIGVPKEATAESYQAIDTDKDGKVSVEEFMAAIRSYVLGQSNIGMLG
ncbi:EF-hand domain-containing protein [Streptomyces sp. MST-110588]|uniref:EF-hand domain-containing protein n=1 Tax=Streptomyces sp. MST-110588 TaxID=2833628 RepID=UPI001F5C64AC|nr:EF-hand domain-containing protein [Streptomyces sp. MST-110588]UNO43369.1 EF-hand domain-containing protein [Streptomyces sp. MST-110588]